MFVIITKNYKEMSKRAAEILIDEMQKKPNIKIGFATGETPLGLYKELVKSYRKHEISFSKVISFNLDEYYPIKKSDKNSYYCYMFNNFFNKVNIKKSNINLLNGETKNPKKECKNYENKIKKNPLDIQFLGIGENGHIALNEPYSTENSKTRTVKLSEKTRKANSRFFKKSIVPKEALTIGISTIMRAKRIILLASGKEKARAVKTLVENKINKNFPASFLKKHKSLIMIIDKKASSMLKN